MCWPENEEGSQTRRPERLRGRGLSGEQRLSVTQGCPPRSEGSRTPRRGHREMPRRKSRRPFSIDQSVRSRQGNAIVALMPLKLLVFG